MKETMITIGKWTLVTTGILGVAAVGIGSVGIWRTLLDIKISMVESSKAASSAADVIQADIFALRSELKERG